MSDLLFIRHAETDLAGTFCGHADPPLNGRGHAQIRNLIAQLGSQSFDAVYSSDLRRAVDTASELARALNLPCTTTSNLREISFGSWEGLTWSQIEENDSDYAARWLEFYPSLPAPGGEPYAIFKGRILYEVNLLRVLAVHKHLAVVTHAGVMRIVLQTLLGHSEQEAWKRTTPYCSYFALEGAAANQQVSP